MVHKGNVDSGGYDSSSSNHRMETAILRHLLIAAAFFASLLLPTIILPVIVSAGRSVRATLTSFSSGMDRSQA